MSYRHNFMMTYLGGQIMAQLDRAQFQVRINAGRVRRTDETYYIPDVIVFPTSLADHIRDRADVLEAYDAPLPLIVEVWSPSTGAYDVDGKLPEYIRRGDQEIWRLHLFEQTLTIWRRMPNGTYDKAIHHNGRVELAALPGVRVDLDALWG